jgi:hypothetical protein
MEQGQTFESFKRRKRRIKDLIICLFTAIASQMQ